MTDHEAFKAFLDNQITKHPELFPVDIVNGYTLNGKSRAYAKLDNLQFRKIEINGTGDVFSVYPSFVMPHLTAYTVDVEKALLLRKHDVPYSTLAYIFGKDKMYWCVLKMLSLSAVLLVQPLKMQKNYQKILVLMIFQIQNVNQ